MPRDYVKDYFRPTNYDKRPLDVSVSKVLLEHGSQDQKQEAVQILHRLIDANVAVINTQSDSVEVSTYQVRWNVEGICHTEDMGIASVYLDGSYWDFAHQTVFSTFNNEMNDRLGGYDDILRISLWGSSSSGLDESILIYLNEDLSPYRYYGNPIFPLKYLLAHAANLII